MKYGDVLHNTEDKNWWQIHGVNLENKFVDVVCPKISLNAEINPEKEQDPTAPDLIVNGRLADLKTQNTPFFTVSRYSKKVGEEKVPFDPSYAVTFNKKDCIRYRKLYPDIDIYFWVHWKETEYENNGISVLPISGVWYVNFQDLLHYIKEINAPLHKYRRRYNDQGGNAKESFVLDLCDFQEIVAFR